MPSSTYGNSEMLENLAQKLSTCANMYGTLQLPFHPFRVFCQSHDFFLLMPTCTCTCRCWHMSSECHSMLFSFLFYLLNLSLIIDAQPSFEVTEFLHIKMWIRVFAKARPTEMSWFLITSIMAGKSVGTCTKCT